MALDTVFDTLAVENATANPFRRGPIWPQLIAKIASKGMRNPLPWREPTISG